MRMFAVGVVTALLAAVLPDVVGACVNVDPDEYRLVLERVEVDGAESADRSAYEGYEVSILSYGDGQLEWFVNDSNGVRHFYASYDASL